MVFGYLYAWSGNLLYPIIGHFTNNGFTLIMFYFYQQKAVPIDIEDTASVPLTISISALMITFFDTDDSENQFSRFRGDR